MTPISRLRGPSRDLLAWPLFDSRHREDADAGAIEVQKLIIGRDILRVA
jgi:hypothetical protein